MVSPKALDKICQTHFSNTRDAYEDFETFLAERPSDRPGQARGIPDITPALPLFAQLRRFTLAVLAAAETAADDDCIVIHC